MYWQFFITIQPGDVFHWTITLNQIDESCCIYECNFIFLYGKHGVTMVWPRGKDR